MNNVVLSTRNIDDFIADIANEVIKKLELYNGYTTSTTAMGDQWFNLDELCTYLPDKPAKATIYGQVHAGTIPCHKGAKKLRFLKSEIDEWLRQGKRKTFADAANEAATYVNSKK